MFGQLSSQTVQENDLGSLNHQLVQDGGMQENWENRGEPEQDLHGYSSKITEGENIGKFQCNLCGKMSNQSSDSFKHVENIHFPGSYQYECDQCGKKFDTRNELHKHRSYVHSSKKAK